MNLRSCTLCPRRCGSNRESGKGFCGEGSKIRIARAALHFGEEPCISGTKGSGTVFFSGCALRCRFCQNAKISHEGFGAEVEEERLGRIFLELQEQGAHNLNLVTPSHFAPQIAAALKTVRNQLKIPIVFNGSGYESPEILQEFNGLVDIYLTDLKYFDSTKSMRYSAAEDYFAVASQAIQEMFRQVGPCRFSRDGLLQRGLLIRHLILPGCKEDSINLIRWVANHFSPEEIRISLMRQYAPCGDLSDCPEINRTLFTMEYDAVLREARKLDFLGYGQGRGCDNFDCTPSFDLTGI